MFLVVSLRRWQGAIPGTAKLWADQVFEQTEFAGPRFHSNDNNLRWRKKGTAKIDVGRFGYVRLVSFDSFKCYNIVTRQRKHVNHHHFLLLFGFVEWSTQKAKQRSTTPSVYPMSQHLENLTSIHLSHKKTLTFHYTGCWIGSLI